MPHKKFRFIHSTPVQHPPSVGSHQLSPPDLHTHLHTLPSISHTASYRLCQIKVCETKSQPSPSSRYLPCVCFCLSDGSLVLFALLNIIQSKLLWALNGSVSWVLSLAIERPLIWVERQEKSWFFKKYFQSHRDCWGRTLYIETKSHVKSLFES